MVVERLVLAVRVLAYVYAPTEAEEQRQRASIEQWIMRHGAQTKGWFVDRKRGDRTEFRKLLRRIIIYPDVYDYLLVDRPSLVFNRKSNEILCAKRGTQITYTSRTH